MKKWMLVSIVISLVLVLTACGSAKSSSASATASTTLSLEEQLLVGTLKLESTTLAVSSDQADQLLPLWETLQSMASSGTAASQEVDAVVSQIESTMSAEQISSITAMNLTQQDLAAAVRDTGAYMTSSSSASTTDASSVQLQASAGAPPSGGNPPNDMGAGMPAATGAQSTGQTQTGTTQAVTSQSTGNTSQVTTVLINTLVELLQKKIA
jgi:peptidoglycan DL-endopeptidase CwlO